jgi:hypothetical protein
VLELDSSPGGGTRLYVRVPMAADRLTGVS